jgi:plasmid stability protein
MSTTLTVRTDSRLREALQRRASIERKSVSDLVREILREALAERPLSLRAGHLKGRLELPATLDDPWQRQIRERNWRS